MRVVFAHEDEDDPCKKMRECLLPPASLSRRFNRTPCKASHDGMPTPHPIAIEWSVGFS